MSTVLCNDCGLPKIGICDRCELVRAEQAVLDAALAWDERATPKNDWALHVAIRAYRAAKDQ
jgi:hypothetical protein